MIKVGEGDGNGAKQVGGRDILPVPIPIPVSKPDPIFIPILSARESQLERDTMQYEKYRQLLFPISLNKSLSGALEEQFLR